MATEPFSLPSHIILPNIISNSGYSYWIRVCYIATQLPEATESLVKINIYAHVSLLESCHFVFLSPLSLFTCCCPNTICKIRGLVLYLHYLHSTCDTFNQILMYHSLSQRNSNQTDPHPSVNVKENTLHVLPLPTPSWLFHR